ncbi:HEPN domain-containing protein [Candidatus Magnetomoraceae bacterium gMMP-15]
MKLITKEWLSRAKDDLDVIEDILNREHLTNMVAFHSQQALEKTFKAIIEEFEIGFIRTHKLELLLERIKDYITFPVDIRFIKRLDEVYIDARYPTDLGLLPYGKPTSEDAKKFYEFAKNIYDSVIFLLNEDNK